MPVAIQWSAAMNEQLIALRTAGQPWHTIAVAMGVCRNACIDQARVLGLATLARVASKTVSLTPAEAARAHLPLEAGHPVSWGILMQLTPSLHGA